MLFPPLEKVTTTDKGHGRIEIRNIKVLSLSPGQVSFPFANQIFSVERLFMDLRGSIISSETCFGISSLTANEAGPARLLEYNRGHWTIENKVHCVRDVSMNEDSCRIRKGSGPRIMAILRNIVLNILRSAGKTNIAATIQGFAYSKFNMFSFIGLNRAPQ